MLVELSCQIRLQPRGITIFHDRQRPCHRSEMRDVEQINIGVVDCRLQATKIRGRVTLPKAVNASERLPENDVVEGLKTCRVVDEPGDMASEGEKPVLYSVVQRR